MVALQEEELKYDAARLQKLTSNAERAEQQLLAAESVEPGHGKPPPLPPYKLARLQKRAATKRLRVEAAQKDQLETQSVLAQSSAAVNEHEAEAKLIQLSTAHALLELKTLAKRGTPRDELEVRRAAVDQTIAKGYLEMADAKRAVEVVLQKAEVAAKSRTLTGAVFDEERVKKVESEGKVTAQTSRLMLRRAAELETDRIQKALAKMEDEWVDLLKQLEAEAEAWKASADDGDEARDGGGFTQREREAMETLAEWVRKGDSDASSSSDEGEQAKAEEELDPELAAAKMREEAEKAAKVAERANAIIERSQQRSRAFHRSLRNKIISRMWTMVRDYSALGGKSLKVFLSSTFVDMQEERDLLLKRYVPALRSMLAERGVYLTVVDLRWGVLSTEGNETVNICMSEVTQSQYFVCFLGHRNGWYPTQEQISIPTFRKFQWLPRLMGSAVTEIEIMYAALGCGEDSPCRSSFFYFRDKEHLKNFPEEEMWKYAESEEMKVVRMEGLKKKICDRYDESVKMGGRSKHKNKLPPMEVRRDYKSPAEFAKYVYDDLLVAIERDYPLIKLDHPLDNEFMRHVSYAKPLVRVYEGAMEEWQAVNGYVQKGRTCGKQATRTPLLITGPAGIGKSAVLANWFLVNRLEGFVLPHFVGASSDSTSHVAVVERILRELQRAFDIPGEVPKRAKEMFGLLPLWLERACSQAPIVLIIDGIDKLHGAEAWGLSWLPPTLPSGCSLLLSLTDSSEGGKAALEAIGKLRWRERLAVDGLRKDEKKKVIESYLKLCKKSLDPRYVPYVVDPSQSENPLFLKLVLDEQIATGTYETIEQITKDLMSQPSCVKLCEVILLRFETDYGADKVGLLFGAIYASRMGMCDEELQALLGMAGEDWSPFFQNQKALLAAYGGRYNIAYSPMTEAVVARYFGGAGGSQGAEMQAMHQTLIRFFQTADESVASHVRVCEELPYHLTKVGDRAQLEEFCLNMKFVTAMLKSAPADLKTYWRDLGTPDDLGERYTGAVQAYHKTLLEQVMRDEGKTVVDWRMDTPVKKMKGTLCGLIGDFLLGEMEHYQAALVVQELALKLDSEVFEPRTIRLATDQRKLAKTEYLMGEHDAAAARLYLAHGVFEHLMKTAEGATDVTNASIAFAANLVELAVVSQYADDLTRAKGLCTNALNIYVATYGEAHMLVADVLNKLALLSFGLSEFTASREYAERAAETVQRACSGVPVVDVAMRGDLIASETLRVHGKWTRSCGNPVVAIDRLEQALAALTKCYGDNGLPVADVLEDLFLTRLKLRHSPPAFGDAEEEGTLAFELTNHGYEANAEGIEEFLEQCTWKPPPPIEDYLGVQAAKTAPLDKRMVYHALSIRKGKQPPAHIQLAYTYIACAEWHWVQDEYKKVIENLTEAVRVCDGGKQAKMRAKLGTQCCSWISLAHMCIFCVPNASMKECHAAIEWGERAEERLPASFGKASWEAWRVLMDKVTRTMYSHGPEATKAELAKAHSACERFEVNAIGLQKDLKKKKAPDAAKMPIPLTFTVDAQRQRCKEALALKVSGDGHSKKK